ncbi:type I-E CRISPR-associated protein Cas5/CasD [Streptomyces sp. IB2014 016-6]|uniref:type I-E CRISPR-associated protein Cas5/CasD n=1 Tax=Streptomyces sp. IB2014 016-6 TaxID=2517818 RepID=UPI0011CAD455|nr:type I-E CRISPR-associated protein Cas5/CasD [Streptomyces sp. IB2014 016-6]TXL84734.1 type I-E CRISPR-associated protein Cas5/CasD [Streptomyces sp. IB2014 016-6]
MTTAGLILRLSGLLQSWGERGVFHHRDTAPFPTRSALIGMFAAAQGRSREEALAPYPQFPDTPDHRDLTFTLRIDRPGTLYRDLHTVGGGRPPEERLHTANGGHRPPAGSTLISHRDYLTDAVFTAAVQGPDALITHIADTLNQPRYAPFLGRRTCPPDEPLVVARTDDPLTELRERVPLSLSTPPRPGADSVPITFVFEHPPPGDNTTHPHRESAGEPVDFTTADRSHLPRPLWFTTEELPARLYAGPRPIDALAAYMHGTHP